MSAVPERTNILLVDDRSENLLALEAALEPLDQNLISVTSGDDALRELLQHDFAAILLDVQMPVLDGFETAALIKQRERTRHVPIIFITAISKDESHVFRGYSAGAVDYIFKPYDPDVLRSKVAVFVELYLKNRELERHQALLGDQELARVQRESEERYRFLAESIPQQVWTARPDGALDYVNHRCIEYFGVAGEELIEWGWGRVVHPDDLPPVLARWQRAIDTGESYEVEFRLRRADGGYRWHLGRAVAMRNEQNKIDGWFGTNTDIDDHKRSEEAQRFLGNAGAVLGSSLDYRRTLVNVAELAVPAIADWCAVHVLGPDGALEQIGIAHVDPAKTDFAQELQRRYPPDPHAKTGVPNVVRTGEAELVAEITDGMLQEVARDDLHLSLLREFGLRSYMCVPLRARGRTLGALTFGAAESGRVYDTADLAFAEDLARRAAMAIENAQLYEEAEARARAARVLASVGDGVFMVDADGVIQLWNPAAEAITGLRMSQVIGRSVEEVLPSWPGIAERVPIGSAPGPAGSRAETLPLEVSDRELWISISGVGFDEGTVFAFRDLTEQRALEQMKTDFVATVSHELRTPLAAIYGAALTIRREDLDLDDDMRDRLLSVIAEESDRLAEIVNDLLLASHLDSGRLPTSIEACDVRALVESVIDVTRTYLPEGIALEFEAPDGLPLVNADPGHLRQVISNLVDNAIKYSPDGGPVQVSAEAVDHSVRVAVRDEGLGIAPGEQKRIFEKFYRLDPNMTRGIGGTGLGLYICRELVRNFGGKIWVDSAEGRGSTFFLDLPRAEPSRRRESLTKETASAG